MRKSQSLFSLMEAPLADSRICPTFDSHSEDPMAIHPL